MPPASFSHIVPEEDNISLSGFSDISTEEQTQITPDLQMQFQVVSDSFSQWITKVQNCLDRELISFLMFLGLYETGQQTKLSPTIVSHYYITA